MKHLHCTTCKFTLLCTPEDAKTYAEAIPVHCGQPMIPDGVSDAPAPKAATVSAVVVPAPKEDPLPFVATPVIPLEEPKPEKKGVFGGKKKKK